MSTDTTVTGALVHQSVTPKVTPELPPKTSVTSNSDSVTGNLGVTRRPKKEGFYTTDEVAKILGVTKQAVIKWRQKKIFGEDILDHCGVYWYSAERVEQLQSVYRKDWHRSHKKNDHVASMSSGQNVKDSCSNLPCVVNQNEFKNILQGKLTNAFLALSAKDFHIDKYANNAYAIVNNVKFSVCSLDTLKTAFKFDATVQRIFDIFVLKLTANLPYKKELTDSEFRNFQQVSISLKEYMGFCNIKSNKTRAIEQLRNALNLIARVQVEFSDVHFNRKHKSESEYYYFRIADGVRRDKFAGNYSIFFSVNFLKYLSQTYIMPFNLRLLAINLKHTPHAYKLARRLLLHHNMNFFKSNANIISVKVLLDSTDIPTYEQLKGNGQLKQKIIMPVESNLDYLQQNNFLEWKYASVHDYCFQKWNDSYIEFKIPDFPTREKNNPPLS